MLETGIREDSALAKIKKEGVMRVGFSQTGPWFYRDAKTGELGGIYKDAVERLAKELEVKVDWKEVTFANSTIGLRRGDYDLYGSSLTYTIAAGADGELRGAALVERQPPPHPQGQRRKAQDGSRPQRPERQGLGHRGRQRGGAHPGAAGRRRRSSRPRAR